MRRMVICWLTIGFVKQEVSSDKFFEAPILSLDKSEKQKLKIQLQLFFWILSPVCSLALHSLGLLPLGVEDAEFELGAHFALVAGDEQEVEGEVVLRLLVQALRVDPQAPLELVVLPGREGGGLEHLAHLLAAEGEVGDGPHVGELDHLDLGVAPVLCHWRCCIIGGRRRHPATSQL